MIEIVLIIALVLCLDIARRRDFMAPGAVFCLIATMTMVIFYVVSVRGFHTESISRWWQVRNDYSSVAWEVMRLYFGLALMGYVADRLTWRKRPAGIVGVELKNPSDAPETMAWIDRYLSSVPAFALLLLCLVLCAAHLSQLDVSKILLHHQYLSVRTASEVAIRGRLLGFLHTNIPMLGCLLAIAMVFYLRLGRVPQALLTAVMFVYCAALTLSFGSRYFVLQLFLIAVFLQLFKRKGVSLGAVIMGILAFLAYSTVISVRRASVGKIGDFGLVPTLQFVMDGSFLLSDMWFFVFFYSFGGGFSVAEALTREGVWYPLQYKLLAFSPLPSMIDGYGAVRNLAPRINVMTPFSSFAEAYHFGPLYLAGFLAFLFMVLVVLTRFWRRTTGRIAFVLVGPAYYSLFCMHIYRLRHTIRWLLIPTLVVLLCEVFLLKRGADQKREAPARSGNGTPAC